jgi:type II secretory pathway component PulF
VPLYRYKARDKEGALHTGTMEARAKDAVADQLGGMGFIPVLIEAQTQAQRLVMPDLFARFTAVKPQDMIVFSRQLATMISAGIPLLQSLFTMERQTENARLKQTIGDVRRDLEAGVSFSGAIAKHPVIFSKMYVNMIRAGETAGILDDILSRLALLAEHEADTRARVKTAVRYPILVLVAISVAFVFLVTFVIPKFAAVFAQFKTELPFPTRVLIQINHVMQNYWYFIVLGIGLLVWGVRWYLRTEKGRWQWDKLKLKLPIFGVLFQKVALSRFARIFSSLQKSGVSMMLTLEIAAETTGNVVISHAVNEMRDRLREGKSLHGPMEASGLFPPLVVQMMAVGEETGNIDTMLNKVSDYYDADVEYTLRNLSTMIEPLLLLVIGGMVLFIALGIFLPMWNLISLFKH